MLPEFSRAARIHLNQFELTQRQAMAAAALDQLQIGVIVIDRGRHVLHANTFARDLLAHGGIVAAHDGRLSLRYTEADGELRRLIDEPPFALSDPLPEAAFRLRTFVAGDWQVSVSPFVDDGSLNLRDFALGAFLVTFKRFEQRQENLAATLAGEFRLAPAEASIVEQIVRGGTLQQIAQRKSISVNTIKTHLKSIFFKMDVSSQADLIRAILARGDAVGG
jgi:DNA-binding CsgD family transcriptional regulator